MFHRASGCLASKTPHSWHRLWRAQWQAEPTVCVSHSVVLDAVTPWTGAHQAPLSVGSPGKRTGAGHHALFQGIFPIQKLYPRLLCLWIGKWVLYHLSRQGTLETDVDSRTLSQPCTHSGLTLCDFMGCSPPGSSVRDSQARTLVWVAVSFSRGSSWPRDWTSVSCISCTGRRVLYPLSHHKH